MKITEGLWKVVNSLQKSALIHSRIRLLILRGLGASLHQTSWIGENVHIGSAKIQMGKFSGVNVGSFLDGNAKITIGDFTRCGPYMKILTGTHKYRNSVIRRRVEDGTISKPVVIEKGCWIGMGTIILPGITIKEGCVIAAGSVVVKDTQPNCLYAGNPARLIKELPTLEDEIN